MTTIVPNDLALATNDKNRISIDGQSHEAQAKSSVDPAFPENFDRVVLRTRHEDEIRAAKTPENNSCQTSYLEEVASRYKTTVEHYRWGALDVHRLAQAQGISSQEFMRNALEESISAANPENPYLTEAKRQLADGKTLIPTDVSTSVEQLAAHDELRQLYQTFSSDADNPLGFLKGAVDGSVPIDVRFQSMRAADGSSTFGRAIHVARANGNPEVILKDKILIETEGAGEVGAYYQPTSDTIVISAEILHPETALKHLKETYPNHSNDKLANHLKYQFGGTVVHEQTHRAGFGEYQAFLNEAEYLFQHGQITEKQLAGRHEMLGRIMEIPIYNMRSYVSSVVEAFNADMSEEMVRFLPTGEIYNELTNKSFGTTDPLKHQCWQQGWNEDALFGVYDYFVNKHGAGRTAGEQNELGVVDAALKDYSAFMENYTKESWRQGQGITMDSKAIFKHFGFK